VFDRSAYTHGAIVDLWRFFLSNFKEEENKETSNFGPYFNQVLKMAADNTARFVLDYADLDRYVMDKAGKEKAHKVEDLCELILADPDEASDTLRTAVAEILLEVNPSYLSEIKHILRADFKGIPIIKEIPDLNMDDVGKPMKMDAIVLEADELERVRIDEHAWICTEGHVSYTYENKMPVKCRVVAEQVAEDEEPQKCHAVYFRHDDNLSKKTDYIELKVQQRLDRMDEKKRSVDIEMMAVGRDLTKFVIDELQLADYCTINGTVRLKKSRSRTKNDKDMAEIYLEASDIEIRPESALTEYDPQYAELVKLAVTSENEEADYEKLLRSVCPSFFATPGDPVKEALLLMLVGAEERKNRDNTRLRGEIQLLLLGDKGGGKSLLLKWAKSCRPRSFYTSGSKTSAVSLIGGMKPAEDDSKRSRLAVGIFGIADLVIIDELEKRKPEELDALAEPMQDSQSIHIGRALSIKNQDISVAVLAGANPTGSLAKYDITKDIFTNTKLPAWLLDRFDAIFIMRDIPNKAKDKALFDHIISTRKQGRTTRQFQEGMHDFKRLADDYYPIGYMKQWITYVRDTFHPQVADSPEALAVIEKFFHEYRKLNIRQPRTKEEQDNWSKDQEMPAVQWRTLQSLLRFAEASARAHHRNNVTKDDAERAVNIIRTSIASSGMNNFTEIKMIEDEVNEIENRVAAVADREETRKKVKDFNYDMRVFYKGIVGLSWKRCEMCHGDGFKEDDGTRRVCDVCDMEGGKREPFDFDRLKEYCKEKNVGPNMFKKMWMTALNTGQVSPNAIYPVLYDNNMKDDQKTISHMNLMREPLKFDNADALFIKAQKARNPELAEYIDKVVQSHEYEQDQ
jgi:replicative DNA helicase Mcm